MVMSKDIGSATGRGGVKIPALEMTGWRVTPYGASRFLANLLLRNSFSRSPANFRGGDPLGSNSLRFENPYDELYLPPTQDKPGGLIRSRLYRPIDRSQSGTRHYEFLSAPKKNKAGAFATALAFQHHLKPELQYGIAGDFETLDVKSGKSFVRLNIFDGGPDLTLFGQPMQHYLIEERDKQDEDQKALAKVMRECVTFLSE
jgi:hypothetical protein